STRAIGRQFSRNDERVLYLIGLPEFRPRREFPASTTVTVISCLVKKCLPSPLRLRIFLFGPWPPWWWKFVFSVSEPEKFLPQLPYNERSQCNQGLAMPLQAAFSTQTCLSSCQPSIRRI